MDVDWARGGALAGRPRTRAFGPDATVADVSDYLGVRLKHLDDIAGAVEHAGAAG